jgi:pentatricopeptide repeat protein
MKKRCTYMTISIGVLVHSGLSFITKGPNRLFRFSSFHSMTNHGIIQTSPVEPTWTPSTDEFTYKLESYSSNIARTRKNNNTQFIHAVHSFYFNLRNQQDAIQKHHNLSNRSHTISTDQRDLLSESLKNTLIQAIRGLAELGEYTMILKLLDAAVSLAREFSLPILQPRIFGEAFLSLAQKTLCSTSKIKKLWNTFVSSYSTTDTFISSCIFITPPSAIELTAMMTALAHRGKVKAALQLFYSMTNLVGDTKNVTLSSVMITPDSYTVSEMMRILADSIPLVVTTTHEPNDSETDSIKEDSMETGIPIQTNMDNFCWQWEETIDILDWAESQTSILNNHVYSAALKVNDRAHILFGMKKHKSAQNALSMLDRMKVSPFCILV